MKVNMNQIPNTDSGRKQNKKTTVKKEKPKKLSASKTETTAVDDSDKKTANVQKETFADLIRNGNLFRKNKFWIVISVILFVIFLSVNSNLNNMKTYFRIQIKNITNQTSEFNAAIAEVQAALEEQARIDSIKLTNEEEELARNDAKVEGSRVADLQNRYHNYAPGASERQEIKTSLAACFDNNSAKGQTEWYIVTKNANDEWSGIPGTWEFVTNAAFKGNTTKVLWLCYSDDRILLAYCTARYNTDTKLFSDVDWKMTTYAQANMKSDDGPGYNKSLVDDLKNLAENGEIEIPSEEINEDTMSINGELSNTRDAYKQSISDNGELYDENYNIGLIGGDDDNLEDTSMPESDEESESSETSN